MAESPEGMARWLISLAADLQSGKPPTIAVDELEEAVEEWREEFPEE